MKKCILCLLLLPAFAFSQTGDLELTIHQLPELRQSFCGRPFIVALIRGNQKVDTTITNDTVIVFKKLNPGIYSLEIGASILCDDSVTTRSYFILDAADILGAKMIRKSVVFPFDCKINKYKGGKICPVCRKNDNVIPIYWGLPDPLSIKGEVGEDYTLGGCRITACDASWHCKRDNLDF